MSVLHTGQRAHPVAVEVIFWRHVQHKQCPHGIMATSQITIRHNGQVVDYREDWDVEATGCDLGIVFAAALLRTGRSRKRRGVTVLTPELAQMRRPAPLHDCIRSLHRRLRQTHLPQSLLLNRQHHPSHDSSNSSTPQPVGMRWRLSAQHGNRLTADIHTTPTHTVMWSTCNNSNFYTTH